MLRTVFKIFFGAALLALIHALPVSADDVLLKPFILAPTPAGNMEAVVTTVKSALMAQGFEEAGSYSPYSGATILVVTSPQLKAVAARSELGGFGAALRVAVTQRKDKLQVSYTNPIYMANAYRMTDDLKSIAAKLEAALGKGQEFGAKGLTAKKLRKYHYTFGMEYFSDPSVLAEYGSHEQAVQAVEAGLAAAKAGVTKVYRVDVPGKQEVVFGVAMKAASEKDKSMDDKYIMSEIDFRDVKSTAHLPYEMLVSGNKAYALYARFRIATSFPDLSMMGSNSFMNIMSSPEAIRKALVQVAGGKE